MISIHQELAQQIADKFAALHQVESVALGGSRGSHLNSTDEASDIDLYVYTRGEIPLAAREKIVEVTGGATKTDLGLDYWGLGDEWFHAPSSIEVDIVYFDTRWMENQMMHVLYEHQASLGYTTCFWYTLRQSTMMYDPHGWLAKLQMRSNIEYPQSLRRNIITRNYPLLRGVIPSYSVQIEKAVKRRDLVSINHRLAAFFASYFDILFALNRQLHPGEKRQVEFALKHCKYLPAQMEADLASVLLLREADIPDLPNRLNCLLDRLDELLEREGFEI